MARPAVELTNRQWVLRRRPVGVVALTDFEYRTVPFPEAALEPGEVLVRNLVFQCAPTMRNWMNDSGRSYRASIGVDRPIVGPACAEVIQSADPDFVPGDRLVAVSTWQDYSTISPGGSSVPVLRVPSGITPVEAVGVYGFNSLTAYFGLLRVGRPLAGETLIVSAAAGAVGSVVVQIGKIAGCRVIGIAGGSSKCDWLVNSCHADAAIDYRTEDVGARLGTLAPSGINVLFDNVGGDILAAAMPHMAVHGRIVVCGQISAYDSNRPAPGPPDMMRVVYGRLRIEGFVTGDFLAEADAARTELMRWVGEGRLVSRVDVRRGFESLPSAFLDLFTGANRGILLVEVANAA